MSSNPNNAVGTNAAYGGRTSVKAFNDNIGAYSRGILSGWACSPSSGMTVSLGGDGTTRDIAIAEDVSGNKITVNNISESPISVTMSAAPASNSRIDLIVAYVDNPPQGSGTALDNPAACGLITVSGTAAVNPVAPNESAIRTAITADGASGSTAYYVVLAQVTIASGTTDIIADNIAAGSAAGISAQNIDFATFGGKYHIWEITEGLSLSNGTHALCEFTIQKAGKYAVQGVIGGQVSSADDYCMVTILKNDVTHHQAVSSCIARGSVPRCDVPFYTIVDCAVNDKIKVNYTSPGSVIRAGTTISAELLY